MVLIRNHRFPRLYDPGRPDGDNNAGGFTHFVGVRCGFLQTKGNAGNGCVGLYKSLDYEFSGRKNGHAVNVQIEAWNDSPRASAELLYRLARNPKKAAVVLIGYSWGAGYGVTRVARILGERYDIEVAACVLCDPVYYAWGRWWRSLLRCGIAPTISIPPNVRNVFWFRQFKDRPAGHDLVPESTATRIHDPAILDVGHTHADNHDWFHLEATSVCRQVLELDDGRIESCYSGRAAG